jgi:hypothetical protein
VGPDRYRHWFDGSGMIHKGGIEFFALRKKHHDSNSLFAPLTSWVRLRLHIGSNIDHMFQADARALRAPHLDEARDVFAKAIKHRPRIRLTIRQKNEGTGAVAADIGDLKRARAFANMPGSGAFLVGLWRRRALIKIKSRSGKF